MAYQCTKCGIISHSEKKPYPTSMGQCEAGHNSKSYYRWQHEWQQVNLPGSSSSGSSNSSNVNQAKEINHEALAASKAMEASARAERARVDLEKEKHDDEMALKRRQQELEEKKNRQKRADELRAQGKGVQAFFVEHGMAVGIGVFVVLMGIFVGYQILNSKSNAKDGAEINLRLEGLEDQIKLAIKEGNQDKALELTNQLVHPLHEKWEDQSKYDTWNGYPFYDEWWSKKRQEYKDIILSMKDVKNTSKEAEANKSIEENVDNENTTIDSEIQINSDIEKSNVVYYKIQDPDGYSNLRSTPNGDVIRKVFDTEVFELIGSKGRFKKVRLADGTEGFIHESRLVNAD